MIYVYAKIDRTRRMLACMVLFVLVGPMRNVDS